MPLSRLEKIRLMLPATRLAWRYVADGDAWRSLPHDVPLTLHGSGNLADDFQFYLQGPSCISVKSIDETVRIMGCDASNPPLGLLTVAALLRLAEVEYGPKSTRFALIDLSALCTELFEFYEPLATSKSIKMTLEVQAPVQILGDGDLMREAISNLIGNAIKFTPEAGTINVSVTREDDRPVVRVRDNGIGVEPGERDKIFQRFYRTASGHRVPGSGLGLSIASAIARLHDFDLRFDDNHPGAVFEMVARKK